MTSHLTAAQATRLHSLLGRLQRLEDAAGISSSIAGFPSRSPREIFFRRAKSLDAKLDRLELVDSLGDHAKDFLQLDSRISLLERGAVQLQASKTTSSNIRRVADALKALRYASAAFIRVPDASFYYDSMDLDQRAALLGAPSSAHLCKTLLFSTSGGRFDDDDANLGHSQTGSELTVEDGGDDKTDQFLLLVVPYDSRIDASKLRSALRANKLLMPKKTPCVASAGRAERVLGFPHNGVCVVGGASVLAQNIPIVFAESIVKLDPPVIYLGGGEPDVKLRLDDIHSFIEKTKALVLDITEPRTAPKPVLPSSTEMPLQATATKGVEAGGKKRPSKELRDDGSGEEDESGGGKKPISPADFDELDVRVGIIKAARRHPASDKLMCEEIDLGEPTGARAIVSGIQHYYTPEDLLHRRVCVVANLKPAKLGGEVSNGMVLCASWKEGERSVVKLIEPPPEAIVGDRITVSSDRNAKEPASSTTVKKKKIFESVAERLRLDASGEIVMFDDKPVGVTVQNEKLVCRVPNGVALAKVS